MRYRIKPNGDKFSVARGTPPPAPAGYYRDGRDPYLFHPILKECEYYVPYKEKLSCGRIICGIICDKIEDEITNKDCIECQSKNEMESGESSTDLPRSLGAKQTSPRAA